MLEMEDEAIRWSIRVSKKTALAVREFLDSHGMKHGGLSKFIENALRAYIFRCTVQDIKARNADADPQELQALIDNMVREVRAERRAKLKRNLA